MEEDVDPAGDADLVEPGEDEVNAGIFGEPQGPNDSVLETDEGKPRFLTDPPRKREKKPWPKKANWSAYRTKLAGQCMQRFQFRYMDKRYSDSGYQAVVGKLVHGAYEDAIIRRVKPKYGVPGIASVAELLHLLEFQDSQLAREEKEGITVTASMLGEARKIIQGAGALDCTAAWGAEVTFTLRLGVVVVGGFIDFIQVWGNPPQRVVVTDFKTGYKQLPSNEELYDDPQAGAYLAWAHDHFPTATDISFELRNLRLNKSVWLRYTKTHDTIQRSLARSRKFLADSGDRTANPGEGGEHCTYCPYREGDAKHQACTAYQAMLDESRLRAAKMARIAKQTEDGEEPDKIGGLEGWDMGDLMAEYRASQLGEKANKARKELIKPVLLAKIPNDQPNYRHGHLLASRINGKRGTAYHDPQGLIEGLVEATGVGRDELMADLVKVKKEALDNWVKSLTKDQQQEVDRVLAQYSRLFLGKPTVMVTAKKGMF
jgi:hypothetical protein